MEETVVQLIEKLENLAPYIWQSMVYGVYVRSLVMLIIAGVFTILFFIGGYHFWSLVEVYEQDGKRMKNYNDERTGIALVFFTLCCLCVIFVGFQLTGVLAPEYYAIQSFLP